MTDDDIAVTTADALRLLIAARVVLDRLGLEHGSDEAQAMAQRIVDMTGHSVTDEPPWLYLVCQRIRAGWLPHCNEHGWWWGRPEHDRGYRLWSEGRVPTMYLVERMSDQEVGAWVATLHSAAPERPASVDQRGEETHGPGGDREGWRRAEGVLAGKGDTEPAEVTIRRLRDGW